MINDAPDNFSHSTLNNFTMRMRTINIRRDRNELRTLIVPGVNGSGPVHWQSFWQDEHPDYDRVVQRDWLQADLDLWAHRVSEKITEHSGPVVLVAHGFGCLAAARANAMTPKRIVGGLLVAPADPTKFSAEETLAPIRLGFNWIVVASRNDPSIPFERARGWASNWSSRFVDAGNAGHLDAVAGLGAWPEGHLLLTRLRSRVPERDALTPLAA